MPCLIPSPSSPPSLRFKRGLNASHRPVHPTRANRAVHLLCLSSPPLSSLLDAFGHCGQDVQVTTLHHLLHVLLHTRPRGFGGFAGFLVGFCWVHAGIAGGWYKGISREVGSERKHHLGMCGIHGKGISAKHLIHLGELLQNGCNQNVPGENLLRTPQDQLLHTRFVVLQSLRLDPHSGHPI